MTFLAHGGGWERERGGVLPTWPYHPVTPRFGVSVILGIELLTGLSLRRPEEREGAVYLCSAWVPPYLPCPNLAFLCLDTF